jgi:subtilisin family serine protease
MKITKSINVTAFILLFCVSYAGFSGTVRGQEDETDYYFVDGKKIVLKLSQNYSALKLKPETSAAEIKSFRAGIDSAGVGIVEDVPILQKYNIVLVRIKEGIAPSSFRASTESFSKKKEVESENPVYGVGGIDQVLVNEFIVQFKSEASKKNIAQSIKNKNAEVVKKDKKRKNRYILKFTGKSAREALAISNEYYQDPLVKFIEPNFIRIYPKRPKIKREDMGRAGPSPEAVPIDPWFSKQWYLNNTGSVGVADADIDAPEAWDVQKGSTTKIIAIIDEGVDTGHEDLMDKIVTPYDAIDGDNNQEPNSGDGHGTACAGIAAAMTSNSKGISGIGWKVKIMPVRIAYGVGAGWFTTAAIIADGIETAVDRGAHVLSNSWGGGLASDTINEAIDYAIAHNRVVVFAAGNDSGPVLYPANLSLNRVVIAVSATNEWDKLKTTTSADGENWWGSCFGPEVNVSAPGVHMWTTDISGSGGYNISGDYIDNFNGTSSATPLVAGTAALLLSQNPGWTPNQVRNQLQDTADDLGPSGFDNKFGHGRINACKALGGEECDEPPCPPCNCSTIGSINQLANQNISQTLVNVALLFSTILLFLLFLIIRKSKEKLCLKT